MRKNLLVSLGIVSVALILIVASCKKINMATDLGQDLIPDVDNIHTFDTTIEVQTFQHFFTALNDSLRSTSSYEQFLGLINNDPLFGKTDARMYFQVSLPATRYYFPNVPSKMFLDSVVLNLPYVETYGDSTLPQTIQVSEIAQGADLRVDSIYNIRNISFPTAGVLGSATVVPSTLNDSVVIVYAPDTVRTIQNLRIKLNNSFGQRLMNYDSTNAFYTDSAFKKHFNGFALQSVAGGNAAMGFLLSGASLTLHYRYELKDSAGKFDTTVTQFAFSGNYDGSANYIGRDYSGAPVLTGADDNVPDQLVYVQNNPGTYVFLKIPALPGMSNRIIHLAELQAESVYHPSDASFYPPKLFIDAYESSAQNFAVPYVFSEFISTNGFNPTGLVIFGYDSVLKKDPADHSIAAWRFNLTRYVQNVVNGKKPSYDLRLYARPFVSIKDTSEILGAVSLNTPLNQSRVNQSLIAPLVGRVRLGGGTHPTQRMKMRIVYSKL